MKHLNKLNRYVIDTWKLTKMLLIMLHGSCSPIVISWVILEGCSTLPFIGSLYYISPPATLILLVYFLGCKMLLLRWNSLPFARINSFARNVCTFKELLQCFWSMNFFLWFRWLSSCFNTLFCVAFPFVLFLYECLWWTNRMIMKLVIFKLSIIDLNFVLVELPTHSL